MLVSLASVCKLERYLTPKIGVLKLIEFFLNAYYEKTENAITMVFLQIFSEKCRVSKCVKRFWKIVKKICVFHETIWKSAIEK